MVSGYAESGSRGWAHPRSILAGIQTYRIQSPWLCGKELTGCIGRRVCCGPILAFLSRVTPHRHLLNSQSQRSGDHIYLAPLCRPLEISLLTKLRALCLHSRYIDPLIPHRSTRSLHVSAPTTRTTADNTKNMNWSTSVYTALTSDTEPSIVITFDSAKYIFNAGENTTRAILQSKRGWRKVKALFLTQLGTQRSSGAPGVSLVSFMRSRGHRHRWSSHHHSRNRPSHVCG